ncbi:hypothetical protein BpHYR1_033675 [Brachionus plicatilis]|uniref:UPAR/Ly6 domain-containing protein n=1 Tax=Brachionus plicatilis TaxID=10195 RepID=A0A3M7Q890_BRAPC|nr:hypothetical protein BpHYR1_033675 [Brachionus plicatilis]
MHQILMKTTAILLILSTYIISTTAYQFYCYSCTNCNDPFNATKSSFVLCSNGCYKNLNKIPGSYAVERGCSSSSDGCTNKIYGVLGYGIYNYCCWDNYCNFSMILKFNQYNTIIQVIL